MECIPEKRGSKWVCPNCGFSNDNLFRKRCTANQSNSKPDTSISFGVKVGNYSVAIAKWFKHGCPIRTDKNVDTLLEVCESCEQYSNKQCSVCGCSVNRSEDATRNKARMATEDCPLGKWPNI